MEPVTRLVSLPIGPNKSMVPGTYVVYPDKRAYWYSGTGNRREIDPSFSSNKDNNYSWSPTKSIFGSTLPSTQEITNFTNTKSANVLNEWRYQTFAIDYNSPATAATLPRGSRNAAQPPARTLPGQGGDPQAGSQSQGGDNQPASPAPSVPGAGQITEGKGRGLKIAPGNGLVYPEKLFGEKGFTTKQDVIKFQSYKVKARTGAGGEGVNYTFGKADYENTDGPVYLPIQAPISDQNSVEWGSGTADPFSAAAYHASLGLASSGLDKLGTKFKTLKDDIFKDVTNYRGRLSRAIAAEAASLNNILARTDNVVLNPNMELLFNGPTLRPFNFQFKLSARSKKEAEIIVKIIKYFKYHSAVVEEDNLFLKAPDIFKITYIYGKTSDREKNSHPGLNKFKECALTNFSVDYTPLGSYATFEEGYMVSYNISMQFQELVPIYNTYYTDAGPTIDF